MTVDKLTGRMPLGATVFNKTACKVIASSGEILAIARFGILGTLMSLLRTARPLGFPIRPV